MALNQFIILLDELFRTKLFDLITRFYTIYFEIWLDQFARPGNILCSVELVASEHPYLYIGLMEVIDYLRNVFL